MIRMELDWQACDGARFCGHIIAVASAGLIVVKVKR